MFTMQLVLLIVVMSALGLLILWGGHKLVPWLLPKSVMSAYLALVAALIALIVFGSL